MGGVSSAVMIAVGYPGELIVTGDFSERWQCWFFDDGLPLHRLHAARGPRGGYQQGGGGNGPDADLAGSGDDRSELADLPRGLHLPDARLPRGACSRGDPVRLLRL